jgi:hypothetical protein
MTWILTACFGITMGLCGQHRTFEYATQADCYQARESVLPQVGKGWAVCAPKKGQP